MDPRGSPHKPGKRRRGKEASRGWKGMRVEPSHMDAVLDKLIQSGHAITTGKDWVRLEATPQPQPFNLG